MKNVTSDLPTSYNLLPSLLSVFSHIYHTQPEVPSHTSISLLTMVSSNIPHAPQIPIPSGTKATTSPPHYQLREQIFSLSRSRPAFDTSIFHPSFSNFESNFKAFSALVDLLEERGSFYQTLLVKIGSGSDDRYGTNKRLGKEDIDRTDDTIRYRDYDKNFQNELREKAYLKQWKGGMERLGDLCARWQNDVYVETVERILSDARSFGR